MHLNRHIGAIHHRRQGFHAILVRAAAVAAEDEVIHDPTLSGPIVDAADLRVAPVAERAHRPLWDRLGHRAVDGIENTDLNRSAATARGGITGVEETSFTRHDLDD